MKKFIFSLFIIFAFILFIPLRALAVGDYGPGWNKSSMTVYIPAGNTYSGTMQRAFQKWQGMSFGQLNFQFTDKTPADIEVEFAAKTDGTDGDIGSYSLTVQGWNITHAKITIAPKNTYSSNLIYTVMLHEIGHVLGLRDTKRNLGIMHTPVNETQDIISNDIIRIFRVNGWSYMNKGTTDLKGNFVHF